MREDTPTSDDRRASFPLRVYLLGTIGFEAAQRLQRRLVYELGESEGAALVLCEHAPFISVGRMGSRRHIRCGDDELQQLGIGVRWVNRGGGCVLHQPGQLAAYLALPLQPLGLSVQGYVDRLHGAVIGVLDEFDLRGTMRPDLPGVFLDSARVATVGVAVTRWIAYHGITLNVGNYLGLTGLLSEPGPNGRALAYTSMESRRQRAAPMAKVREAMIRRLEAAFGLEHHYLFTDAPGIGREGPRYAPHARPR